MRKLKFGIPLIGACAIAFGLSGCADESHWGNSSNEKGSIRLNLTADTGIKSAKPVFRSDEGASEADPNNLATYINVPSIDDFSIKLEKSTGEVTSWSSLLDFKEYIAKNQFDIGTYTLTAYHGTKGKQDFEAPYFEASTTFNVLSDQENEISLTAELQNSMVKINYTDAFKDYMKDYHAKIKTDGIGEPITYGNIETRPLFIEPKNANISLHFTTKGKDYTSDIVLGDFAPLAKTLHNITFDLSENASSEEATLEIKFDETLEEEPITIDLTEELLTTPAPTISCTGFENGQTLDMLEFGNEAPQILMTVASTDQIESAILTIESDNYTPSWGKEIDLCKADAQQQVAIEATGIKAQGFGFNDTGIDLMAILDLTNFGKNLVKGNHKVSLVVKDTKGKTSQSTSVIFDNQDVILELIGSPTFIYAADRGELTFDFNGTNPLENVQFSVDGQRVNTISCSEQPATRAAEKKTYTFTLQINNPIKPNVQVTASYKGEKNLGNFTVPVNIPEYSVEAFDSYTKHAYAKISTIDPSLLGAVTQNIKFKGNDSNLTISSRDPSNGIITFSGLTPATTYSMSSSITGSDSSSEWNNNGSMITEAALPVPNGDFEELTETINTTIDQGGQWTITAGGTGYQTTLSMTIKEPIGWVSSNSLTCNLGASNKNSWYVIPSVYNTTLSWVSHQPDAKVGFIGQKAYDSTAEVYNNLSAYSNSNAMVIRNVAWDANGASISTKSQTGKIDYSNYFCSNKPSSIANRTAGYIYLGSAEEEGTDFSSRPTILKGFYKYQNDSQDTAKKGKITVEILNGSTLIGSGQIELEAAGDYTEFNVPIVYTSSIFLPKATTLKIYITSSNKTSDIKTTDYCDKDECCSRGAALTVDNLTFEY